MVQKASSQLLGWGWGAGIQGPLVYSGEKGADLTSPKVSSILDTLWKMAGR